MEAQATDRAHRKGTVEEKIQAMPGRKVGLARAVLEGGASTRLRFDEKNLEALFERMQD